MVNLTFSVFLIATLVLGIPSNYIIVKIGIRRSCIYSSGLIAIGSILPIFINQSFIFVVLGQFVAGCGTPLAINAIYLYCSQSFGRRNVGLMSSFLIFMFPIGVSVAIFTAPLFMEKLPDDEQDDYEDNPTKVREILICLLVHAVLSILSFVLLVIFMKSDKNRFRTSRKPSEVSISLHSLGGDDLNKTNSSSKFATLNQVEK